MPSPNEVEAIVANAKYKANSAKQDAFIGARADWTVFGGAKGGGKSHALEMQAARHIDKPGYTSVIFRQTVPQIRQLGGLWDTALAMYSSVGGDPNESRLEFKFPSGAKIGFGHIAHDRELADWQGSQIAMIGVDQAEEFTGRQLLFLRGLNRPTSTLMNYCKAHGIRFTPRIYATCNPDPDCFLRTFMDWWIGLDGYPIEERSGVIRYYAIDNDKEQWAESLVESEARAELASLFGDDVGIQSFTFIPARIEDNVDLMRSDPGYIARLKSMGRVESERFWLGNWNVRWSAGDYFRRDQFKVMDAAPPLFDEWRYWDRAATVGSRSWTVGLRMGMDAQGRFWITDRIRFQAIAQEVQQRIVNVAHQDGYSINVGIEGDPGQAGKAEAQEYVRILAGYNVVINTVHESKGARARPLSAQVAIGNVYLVRAPWNDEFLRELENFDGSDKCMADQVDAASGAFHMLTAVAPQPTLSFVDF